MSPVPLPFLSNCVTTTISEITVKRKKCPSFKVYLEEKVSAEVGSRFTVRELHQGHQHGTAVRNSFILLKSVFQESA